MADSKSNDYERELNRFMFLSISTILAFLIVWTAVYDFHDNDSLLDLEDLYEQYKNGAITDQELTKGLEVANSDSKEHTYSFGRTLYRYNAEDRYRFYSLKGDMQMYLARQNRWELLREWLYNEEPIHLADYVADNYDGFIPYFLKMKGIKEFKRVEPAKAYNTFVKLWEADESYYTYPKGLANYFGCNNLSRIWGVFGESSIYFSSQEGAYKYTQELIDSKDLLLKRRALIKGHAPKIPDDCLMNKNFNNSLATITRTTAQ